MSRLAKRSSIIKNRFRKPAKQAILSQSYNTTVFYFYNISFIEHVLNQLFFPNESSINQASYRTMVLLQSVSNCSRNKPFYGGRVVEKNEMTGGVPVNDMQHAFRAA